MKHIRISFKDILLISVILLLSVTIYYSKTIDINHSDTINLKSQQILSKNNGNGEVKLENDFNLLNISQLENIRGGCNGYCGTYTLCDNNCRNLGSGKYPNWTKKVLLLSDDICLYDSGDGCTGNLINKCRRWYYCMNALCATCEPGYITGYKC